MPKHVYRLVIFGEEDSGYVVRCLKHTAVQSLGLERTFLDKDINTGGEVRATAAHKLPQRVAQNQNSCSLARNLAPRDSAVEIAAVGYTTYPCRDRSGCSSKWN